MARVFSAPIIGQSAASGAQVIDGSLKFDQSKSQHLIRTFTGGNRRTWTHSSWVRQGDFGRKKSFFMVGPSSGLSNSNYLSLDFDDNDKLRYAGGAENFKVTSQVFRDTGWYHVVWTCDTTEAAAVDRTKIYVNGELITVWSTSSSNPTQNFELPYNENSIVHRIGTSTPYNNDREWNDAMSQVYFIDGAALGPENFGFTDPLTNTWKPKKYKHDKRFYGVTFSNQLSPSDGPWRNSNPKSNGFDGSAATSIALDTLQGTLTFSPNFGQGPFEIEYKGFNDGQTTVTIDGTTLTYSGSNSIWTGTVGSFNTMTMVAQSGNRPGITYIKVNGYMLVDAAADNSFYLPFDGSAPIGEDRIGNGNDWTPVNFGGSVALDNPQVSGARPILNTTQGGTTAGVGVFGSKENKFYTVTTANGSVYQFDITSGDNPSLEFIRGATYRFDYTSHASHPLRFSSTNPDSSTTAYTTGTNTSVSNVITITVPHDAPDTLYYYCTAHASAMNGAISVTTDNTKADQYASNCVLALPLVGSKDDVSASIACTSSTRAVSASGDAAAANESSNFYSGSFEFDGTGDYLDVTESDNCFDFGTGDFTIELWAFLDNNNELIGTANNSAFLGSNKGGWVIRRFDEGIKFNYQYNSSWVFENTFGSEGAKDKWNHIAITRSGSTIRCFSNGVQQGSDYTSSANIVSTEGYCRVGGGYNSTSLLVDGYLQDVRIYKGVAKYTSDFVVPATSPDILPDTPSGVSGSSKLAKIADGAVSFDGTNDDLSIADSSDFTFGTNDFTIEFFRYKFENAVDTYVSKYGSGNSTRTFWFGQGSDGTEQFYWYNGSSAYSISSSASFPINRWSHLAAVKNSGTMTLYVDGVAQVSTTSNVNVSLNDTTENVRIGGEDTGTYDYNGFISNVRIVNGSAVYTSNFTPPAAPLTNVTNTKLLCCQSNSSATAAAVTPGTITANGDAAATNFNPFNTDINTVRGQETGYNTFSPLLNRGNNTLSDGNTFVTGGSNWNTTLCTGVIESGKWFVELTHKGRQSASDNDIQFGLFGLNDSEDGYPLASTKDLAAQSTGYVIVDAQAQWYNNSSSTSYGTTWSTPGDVVGLRYNADTGKLGFIINGVDQGDISSTLSTSQRWAVGISLRGGGAKAEINFGQKPFKFPPPDGFQPLNTANTRPETVISRPDQYVGIATWTGDGTNNRVIQAPIDADFAWIKFRNQAYSHSLYDTVRGNNKRLVSNSTGTEGTVSFSFLENKSIQISGASDTSQNDNNEPLVGWFWRAGGNKNTFNVDDEGFASAAAAGLTAGDTTIAGASVGTKQGFSIIKYTGPNDTSAHEVAHGLSQAPDFIITKNLDNTYNWDIYHSALGDNQYLIFTSSGTDSGRFSGRPTSTVFKTAHSYSTNENEDYIAYCWHDVPGLQKFGTYTGNGNSDGNYIELGFRPSLVIIKCLESQNWILHDSVREPSNPVSLQLYPSINNAEYDFSGNAKDLLSNGFKLRGTNAGTNDTDGTTKYVYAAWAEAPSIDLFGGGANAR